MTSLVEYATFGFQFNNIPTGANTAELTDISVSLFQNPLWVAYFKAVKVRNRVLMPYRTMKSVVSACMRKPGWIWNQGNASNIGTTEGFSYNAIRRWGGITTRVKTLEFVGEIANDATMAPNPLIATSPVVLLIQNKGEFEAAAGGDDVTNWAVGDGTKATVDELLTGQPWNYMFPTPAATSSMGTSVVVGALTSGL